MSKHDWAIWRLSYSELGIDRARYFELKQGCRNGLYDRETLLKACRGMPEGAAAFVVKSAVTGRSFDKIEFDRELGRIGIGRTNFYALKRLFFGNLNAMLRKGAEGEATQILRG